MHPIYLDHNATTPVDPEVLRAMLPFLREEYGNPSSAHALGKRARDAVEAARVEVAALIGAQPREIVFTSGGTEASNIAIHGAARMRSDRRAVVTTTIEHPATDECCRRLEGAGHPIERIPPGPDGRVDAESFLAALDGKTALVTVIHAQNEIGTLQPVAEIARFARSHGALMHADAAQSLGKIPVDVEQLGIDLLSIAGHKLYAPKGVGALFVRRSVSIEPLVHGAGHENGRRAGTESALLAVGLGKACELARNLSPMDGVRALRERFWQGLQRQFGDGVVLNGHPTHRLPNTLNVSFVGRSGAEILARLDGVAASTGSACHSGRIELSPVLQAMGISPHVGMGAIRFSLGRSTTRDEIDAVLERLTEVLAVAD